MEVHPLCKTHETGFALTGTNRREKLRVSHGLLKFIRWRPFLLKKLSQWHCCCLNRLQYHRQRHANATSSVTGRENQMVMVRLQRRERRRKRRKVAPPRWELPDGGRRGQCDGGSHFEAPGSRGEATAASVGGFSSRREQGPLELGDEAVGKGAAPAEKLLIAVTPSLYQSFCTAPRRTTHTITRSIRWPQRWWARLDLLR